MKNLLKGGFFHKIVKKRLRFWRSLNVAASVQLATLDVEKICHKQHNQSVQAPHKSQHSTSTPI